MKGHLIIHDISEKEADKLMKRLKYEADWWTQENIDTLDNAAAFAMLTHNYPKTKDPKHYNKKE
jgi:hypothetical protein